MTKRFAIHPDHVYSVNDRDLHYISFMDLCRLHGVNPQEAVDMSRPESYLGVDTDHLLHLGVSYQGGGYWHVSELERSLYPTK